MRRTRESATRDATIDAISTWCGQWALRIGIPLTDEGEPEDITEDFWYDDGEFDWHDKARNA